MKVKKLLQQAVIILVIDSFLFSQVMPLYAAPAPGGTSLPAPTENKHTSIHVSPDSAAVLRLGDMSLEIPAGAVTAPMEIGVQELPLTQPMDEGMVNVTGLKAGYRFTPDGAVFNKPLVLTVPYDTRLVGTDEAAQVFTYYYDTHTEAWARIERLFVDTEKGRVVSRTTHFTDYINSTLTLPENPKPLSFDPNSIKDLKAAQPSAGMTLIDVPQPTPFGAASLKYPIELPPGRRGMQPSLEVTYNSGGGNGWLGVGWDLSLPAITIDSTFGVPRYSASTESEVYSLDGQRLQPMDGAKSNRIAERQFIPETEGAFNRIIRHGSTTSQYRWEVTDKSGRTRFFGGLPGAVDENAVIRTSTGAIARWSLRQERDTYGNTIDYFYDDVSAARSDSAREVYPTEVRYTGSAMGDMGAYSVTFLRAHQLDPRFTRADSTLDARSGVVMATSDLLREVHISYRNTPVRSYVLDYNPDPFGKQLISAITQKGADGGTFSTHTFDYWDQVTTSTANSYQGFGRAQDVRTSGAGPDTQVFGTNHGSAIGNNKSSSDSVSLYLGAGAPTSYTKANTAGVTLSGSVGKGGTTALLVDLNGDGLPDRTYKDQGGRIYYEPQFRGGLGFGPAVEIGSLSQLGLDSLTLDSSFTISVGAEEHFGPTVSAAITSTTTTGSQYFSDVNGDGLVDLVVNGTVHFNRLVGGVPTFDTSSAGTPFPLPSSGGADTSAMLADLTAKLKEDWLKSSPLMDALRVWTAPFAGTVDISGTVTLESAQSGDGVRVAIQRNAGELWSRTIAPSSAGTAFDASVNGLSVQAGDRVYFRVQSIEDGRNDAVAWSPVIRYRGAQSLDANGKDALLYDSAADFTYGGQPASIMMPLTGTVRLSGTISKLAATTDDVRFSVSQTRGGAVVGSYDRSYAAADTSGGPVEWDMSLAVNKQDSLSLRVESDSPIDLSQVAWTPKVEYLSAADGTVVTDQNGNSLISMPASYDADIYSSHLTTDRYAGWVAPKRGHLVVRAVALPGLSSDPIAFTVKRSLALVAKEVFTGTSPDPVPVDVEAGDRLYFEFSSKRLSDPSQPDSYLMAFQALSVRTSYAYYYESDGTRVDPPPNAVPPVDPLFFPAAQPVGLNIFVTSNPYGKTWRGWGYIAYNGSYRPGLPIDEAALPAKQNADPTKGQSDPPTSFIMVSFPADGEWRSSSRTCAVRAAEMHSSRLGQQSFSSGVSAGGAQAIPRVGQSTQVGMAASIDVVSASAGGGSSYSLADFLDLNGDGFPDIVTKGGTQYTLPSGVLDSATSSGGTIRSSGSGTFSLGVGLGGPSIPLAMKPSPGGYINGSISGGEVALAASFGLSGNFGGGLSDSTQEYIDMNGDGLPDRVTGSGDSLSVELNLGYAFDDPVAWGQASILKGDNLMYSLGFNLGFQVDNNSFGGGLSVSGSSSWVREQLTDINGDGLPDRAWTSGPSLMVQFNTGSGFAPTVTWGSIDSAMGMSQNDNFSLTAGAYFTFAIPVFFFNLIINPGYNHSDSVARTSSSLMNLDGSGQPAYVTSASSGVLTALPNNTGKTGKLRKVSRPLGATIDLDYTRVGNTYDMPQSIWALSSVTVDDGHAGDGVDVRTTQFGYADGARDRLSREFLGFGTVTISEPAGGPGSRVYRTTVRSYLNDKPADKGLLARETLFDSAGNRLTEKANSYEFRNARPQSLRNGPYLSLFPALIDTVSSVFEKDRGTGSYVPAVTEERFDYDELGNVVTYSDLGDQSTAADDLTATIRYSSDQSAWIVGVPVYLSVSGSGVNKLRERSATLNTQGSIVRLTQMLNVGQNPVTTLVYDSFGNVKSVTGPTGYTITYVYDVSDTNSKVVATSDSFGYSSTAAYDMRFGQPTASADENANSMRRDYDQFGRLVDVFGPYDLGTPAVSFSYDISARPATAVTVNKTSHDPYDTNAIRTVIAIDGLERVLQSKKDAEVGTGGTGSTTYGMIASGAVQYDFAGRVIAEGQPVFLSGYSESFSTGVPLVRPTHKSYDARDRLISVLLPDESTQTNQYFNESGRLVAVSTDPEGTNKESLSDLKGNIVEVRLFKQGRTLSTRYTYDGLGEILSVQDADGNISSLGYDTLGRRTSMTTPDTGTVAFGYDAAGNMIWKEDEMLRSQHTRINYTYQFDRLVRIDYPDISPVVLEYGGPGAAANAAGRITRATDESGITNYEYGKMGETVAESRQLQSLAGDHRLVAFSTDFRYDYLGRLEWMRYPDGEELTYTYDKGGQVKAVTGLK